MRLRVLRSLLRLGIDNLHASAQDVDMKTSDRSPVNLKTCECRKGQGECANRPTGWARCDSCKTGSHAH